MDVLRPSTTLRVRKILWMALRKNPHPARSRRTHGRTPANDACPAAIASGMLAPAGGSDRMAMPARAGPARPRRKRLHGYDQLSRFGLGRIRHAHLADACERAGGA